jgi:hypothetical protein
MTALEMQKAFQLKTSKYSVLEGVEFKTSELNQLFNEAQLKLVELLYARFEFDEVVKKYLSRLVSVITLTDPTNNSTHTTIPYSEEWQIPANIKYIVFEEVTYNVKGSRIEVKPISHSYYVKNKSNPFKKPSNKLVWRLDSRATVVGTHNITRHILIKHENTPIEQYFIGYLREPSLIKIENNNGSELHPQTHQNIVDMAVQIAVQNAQARIELRKEITPRQGDDN